MWGNRLLRLTMNNKIIQWVTENTRFREDKLSRLELLFTKGINLEKDINYKFPFGRSDHVVWKLRLREI